MGLPAELADAQGQKSEPEVLDGIVAVGLGRRDHALLELEKTAGIGGAGKGIPETARLRRDLRGSGPTSMGHREAEHRENRGSCAEAR